MAQAGFDPASYAGRALLNVLESYPRDELFQIDEATLLRLRHRHPEAVRAPAHPGARPRRRVRPLRLGPRVHPEGPLRHRRAPPRRRVSRRRLSGARVGGLPGLSGRAARPHALHHRPRRRRDPRGRPRHARKPASPASSAPGATACATALDDAIGGPQARALAGRYADAFSAAYREAFTAEAGDRRHRHPRTAVRRASRAPSTSIAASGDDETRVNLKVFSRGARAAALRARAAAREPRLPASSTSGPTGSRRRARPRASASGCTTWRWSAPPAAPSTSPRSRARSRRRSSPCSAGLPSPTASTASCSKPGSAGATSRWCARSAAICARSRVPYGAGLSRRDAGPPRRASPPGSSRLFYARFDPRAEPATRARREGAIRADIEDRAQGGHEPRRRPHPAPLRQPRRGGGAHQLLPDRRERPAARRRSPSSSNARRSTACRCRRPLYEIFVYSPRVEGVHLRFGKVARGGLRWSDRPQDFRTEVLGLVKAQQVKNAVIVPVGAKGGFVPEAACRRASDRAGLARRGHRELPHLRPHAARSSPTTSSATAIVPPPDTVRHDGDDPYLVVAADKGTATFSDIANAHLDREGPLARRRLRVRRQPGLRPQEDGHHRARRLGGGEAPLPRDGRRHPERSPSRWPASATCRATCSATACCCRAAIKLVAAFDHRDIFLDPDPDPAASFAERERLFDLPRSSWQDYDKALISKGGGVFSRAAKGDPALAARRKPLLGLDEGRGDARRGDAARSSRRRSACSGSAASAPMSAPPSETDEEVGDRANDAIRITGARGPRPGDRRGRQSRRDAARAASRRRARGVRLNTDAIDNSAGVNTSDVEVNIKIALATPERDGRLDRRGAQRASCRDDRRGRGASCCATTISRRWRSRSPSGAAPAISASPQRLMQTLERQGRLDRAVEFLPDDAALTERAPARRGADPAGARRAPRLRQARAARRAARQPRAGRSLSRRASWSAISRRSCASASRTRSRATACAARSSRRSSPTPSSTAAGRRIVTRLVDQTGADAPTIAAAYAATRDAFGLTELNAADRRARRRACRARCSCGSTATCRIC